MPKGHQGYLLQDFCLPAAEYGPSIWDPSTKSNINKLEAVQCHRARFCHSDYRCTSSVTLMMEDLGWEQLACRQQAKASMLYRIVNQLVDIQAASLLILRGSHTRGHTNRFLVQYCSVNVYKRSFYPPSVSGTACQLSST